MKYQKLKRNLYTACVVANLFLIPSPVLWAEQSYAQSTRLSLELSNATISDVFASVEKNSEYRFFYSDAVRAELYRNVDVNIKNKTIDRILSEVLDGTNLTYFLNDRQVMIIRKEEKTQQEKKISINGTVRDAQQEPLPGVNVLVKGTTIGTTTDIDGNYFISVPDKNAVLVFSYIGFESQEVKVGGQININVNMSEESNSLDEVVVVGYGSQKRASVVGSITAIEPAQLQQGTTRAVSNNLAGQLAGVIAVQRNGEPGSDGSDFWIRGISSFKGTGVSPLVLVDGIERTLDDSANKRIAVAEAFLGVDAILNIMMNVCDGLVVYDKVVRARVMNELPFMATENIMMDAVKKGGNRQELHEKLRVHSQAAARVVKEEGGKNDLIDRICADPAFMITREEVEAILRPEQFTGRSCEQVEEYLRDVIRPLLAENADLLGEKQELSV